MPRPPKPAPPNLNERQRAYLVAAYQQDQATEQYQKGLFGRGQLEEARLPASVWRWMPYGRWLHTLDQQPTPLRAALDPALVSPGTGSTWKALAERGLVEVADRTVVLRGIDLAYPLPHVRMTRAGRQLARQLLGEVRPKGKDALVLSKSTWQVLGRLWRLDQRQPQYMNFNSGVSGELGSWEVWDRLERLKPKTMLGRPNQQAVVDSFYFRFTTAGRVYYLLHWEANHAAYPDVNAPDPKLTPELAQRVRELAAQADGIRSTPPAGVFERWVHNLRFPVHATGLDDYERQREIQRGLPADVAGLADRAGLQHSWRRYLQEHLLRETLSPADWNCAQLWQSIKLENGAPAWRTPAPAVTVEFEQAAQLLRATFGEAPRPSWLAAAVSQLRGHTVRHQCGRWLVDLRAYAVYGVPLAESLQLQLVSAGNRMGLETWSQFPVRIALVCARPPLAEWPLPPAAEQYCELAEFADETAARAWLSRPN